VRSVLSVSQGVCSALLLPDFNTTIPAPPRQDVHNKTIFTSFTIQGSTEGSTHRLCMMAGI
jgi:hypothetical protein